MRFINFFLIALILIHSINGRSSGGLLAALGLFPGLGRRHVELRHLARRRAPVGHQLDLELAEADAEELEQPRLPRVEDLALLADGVPFARLARLVGPEHDLALDHARRHAEPAELGLQGVRHGHVVLGGDLASRGVDDAGGHGEGAGRLGAGARKVDLGERLEVGGDLGGVAVGEEQADGARQVGRQLLDAVGLGLLGRGAEGAGGELGLAEEEAVACV